MARTTQAGRAREMRSTAENARLPAAEERSEPSTRRNPPVHKTRYGRVEVAVWARELEEGRMSYSVTLQRSYQDQDGKWQHTSFLDEGDILPAAEALRQAGTWVQEQRQKPRGEAYREQRPASHGNDS